jgi:hypothetical protein
MTKDNENLSNKELLIRIDERQRRILNDISDIKRTLNGKVDNDESYGEMREKVETLWDMKNKLIGYAAGSGAVASLVFEIVKGYIF